MSLKVGDHVKFNHENGSTGKINGVSTNMEDHYYVEWVYGLDIKNRPITSNSAIKEREVILITQEEYNKVRNSPAFGGEFRK